MAGDKHLLSMIFTLYVLETKEKFTKSLLPFDCYINFSEFPQGHTLVEKAIRVNLKGVRRDVREQ